VWGWPCWAGHGGPDYQTHGKYLEETNDAQISVDAVVVAPRIGLCCRGSGRDNQDVKAGTPLVRIDQRDLPPRRAGAGAGGRGDAAEANAKAAIAEQQAAIEQARRNWTPRRPRHAMTRSGPPLHAAGRLGRGAGQQLAQLRANAEQSAAQVRAQSAAIEAQQRRIATLRPRSSRPRPRPRAARRSWRWPMSMWTPR
jgi:membrane fusion protein (multidrug efflux system)